MESDDERTSPDTDVRNDRTESAASAEETTKARAHAGSALTWGERLVQEYAAPRSIALYDVGGGEPYCGLIAPAPSGYLWRQQTSGMLCAQRDLEGIYLPIPDHDLAHNLESLHVGCCMDTRDDWEAGEAYRAAHPEQAAASDAWTREHMPELAAIQDALGSADRPRGIDSEEAGQLDALLHATRLPLSVARDKLERGTEAWVWVRVADDVATWTNEYAAALAPVGDAAASPRTTSYRFQWMFAALAGTEAVLTWQNCD